MTDDLPFKVLGCAFAIGMTVLAALVTLMCVTELATPPLIGWTPMQVFTGRVMTVAVTVMGWGASAVIWWVFLRMIREDD